MPYNVLSLFAVSDPDAPLPLLEDAWQTVVSSANSAQVQELLEKIMEGENKAFFAKKFPQANSQLLERICRVTPEMIVENIDLFDVKELDAFFSYVIIKNPQSKPVFLPSLLEVLDRKLVGPERLNLELYPLWYKPRDQVVVSPEEHQSMVSYLKDQLSSKRLSVEEVMDTINTHPCLEDAFIKVAYDTGIEKLFDECLTLGERIELPEVFLQEAINRLKTATSLKKVKAAHELVANSLNGRALKTELLVDFGSYRELLKQQVKKFHGNLRDFDHIFDGIVDPQFLLSDDAVSGLLEAPSDWVFPEGTLKKLTVEAMSKRLFSDSENEKRPNLFKQFIKVQPSATEALREMLQSSKENSDLLYHILRVDITSWLLDLILQELTEEEVVAFAEEGLLTWAAPSMLVSRHRLAFEFAPISLLYQNNMNRHLSGGLFEAFSWVYFEVKKNLNATQWETFLHLAPEFDGSVAALMRSVKELD